jgi:DNA-binding MarR family transcriptional regulator
MAAEFLAHAASGSVSGAGKSSTNHSLAARWGSLQLFDEGFVGVPASLVTRYAKLGLSAGEFVFVLELMVFKWDEQAPFPSYHTLARRMGITTEMTRRHAKSLESKGMLKRLRRTGQSNVFDLLPLTNTLKALLDCEQQLPAK